MISVKFTNTGPYKFQYATIGAAGIDLPYSGKESILLHSGERKLIPTGISIQLPVGQEAQVRPRSGLALKHGITVLNAPGTIDTDYRGEIGVILLNTDKIHNFEINPGDLIAQLVVAPLSAVFLSQVEELETTERGSGGFGSTDK